MSASTDLCTRDNVKTYLGLSGTTHDDVIDALISAASEAVENFCGRKFDVTAYTEYHHGGGASSVVLQRRPVTEVSGLWDDLARDFDDESLVDSDDYVLDSESGIIHLLWGAAFSDGVRNVKVSYSAGYSSVPDDVAHACVMLVAAWFHRGREGADGLGSRAVEGVSQQFDPKSPPEPVREILAAYREHTV